jgi:anti-sigma factor ChrR (cupin superfamily)
MDITMDTLHTNPDDPADLASLYALGALSADEAEAFEANINAGGPGTEELDEHLGTMIDLCEELASVMPTPRRAVKDAIMATIAGMEAPSSSRDQGQVFILANQGEWQDMAPGIKAKILYADPTGDRTTLLVRIDPGAAYAPHRHQGLEECLVIEGDLHVDGTILRAGDYTASFQDKVHIDTHSEEGCLLLISSPLNDEFLE